MIKSETNGPTTLLEAIKHFSAYENCHAFMVQVRWNGGPVCCPTCGSVRVRYIQTRRQWECKEKHPKRRFSLKAGTIMEDSTLPLEKWLAALWLEINCKNSISSWEAHRALGVTQKTAWFMLHRLRHALHVGSFDQKLCGEVESDETFIGGKATNMHEKRRKKRIVGSGICGKTVIHGLIQRGNDKDISKVIAKVVKDTRGKSLLPVVRKHVELGSMLYTDSLRSYNALAGEYVHQVIDHAVSYVEGRVHTNGMENFWSLFKRCIKGTHISIEPFHLQAYLDSEMFRFNNRDLKDGGRFVMSAPGMIGKRLTYRALIGALEGPTTIANG